jgi:sec-independent protein translocase protein TatB
MFDIGMSEMMVIAVVALVVLGPERLPKVARTLGHLVGRAQRYVNQVKQDINREMELSELKKMQDEFKNAAQEVKQSVDDVSRSVESESRAFESSVNQSILEMQATSPPVDSWSLPPPEISTPSDVPPTKAERIDPR